MGTDAPRGLLWIALLTVYVVWGSTYLAIRVVVETMPEFLTAGARFLTAGLVLGAILVVRSGWSRLKVTPRELLGCGIVGGLLLLGGNGLVVVAEQRIDSGLTALVVAAVPLWVVLFRMGTGDRPRGATIAAVLVGFGGIAVLLAPDGDRTVQTVGILTVLLASLLWSIGSFASGSLVLPADAFVTTVYEMLLGGAFMLLTAVGRREPWHTDLGAASGEAWFALGYLTVFGSLLAFTAYVWLLGNAPISLVATYAYVNPAVAVLLGALILSEPVTWPIAVGGAVVIASVAVVVSVEQRPRGAPPEPAAPPAEALTVPTRAD